MKQSKLQRSAKIVVFVWAFEALNCVCVCVCSCVRVFVCLCVFVCVIKIEENHKNNDYKKKDSNNKIRTKNNHRRVEQ